MATQANSIPYTSKDKADLMRLRFMYAPLGHDDWEEGANNFNATTSGPPRTVASFRDLYRGLCRMKKPTGSSTVSELVHLVRNADEDEEKDGNGRVKNVKSKSPKRD